MDCPAPRWGCHTLTHARCIADEQHSSGAAAEEGREHAVRAGLLGSRDWRCHLTHSPFHTCSIYVCSLSSSLTHIRTLPLSPSRTKRSSSLSTAPFPLFRATAAYPTQKRTNRAGRRLRESLPSVACANRHSGSLWRLWREWRSGDPHECTTGRVLGACRSRTGRLRLAHVPPYAPPQLKGAKKTTEKFIGLGVRTDKADDG